MRAAPSLVLGFLLLAGLTAGGPAIAQAPAADPVARGEYLVRAADCMACHTVPGKAAFAGGRPLKLPFGTIYSRNITPDRDTGIGSWSDDEFVRAMQQGISKNGEHLYPAFPYTSYTKLSREDDLAIKAFLFSLPPVRNPVPAAALSFPYNQRWAMAAWNLLFNPNERLTPDPAKPADWNRGAYLVEALGHCGECHTPRRFTQSLDNSRKFAGAVTEGWKADNITADTQSGVGGWSDEALVSYLSTGHADGHSSASGPMAEAIADGLAYLTPEDLRATVVYLRTVPAISNMPAVAEAPPATKSAAPPQTLGSRIFAGECQNCHRWDGSGAQSRYATLIRSRTVNDPEGTNLAAILIGGSTVQYPTGRVFMPPFGKGRSDDELAAVANFANAYFGNGTAHLTAADIDHIRKMLP
ncbi:MAG TPA: cytochrome c [Alphaproteobacteria bacterium]